MDSESRAIWIPQRDLCARASQLSSPAAGQAFELAAPVPLAAAATYEAVAIDPSSHYRAAYLFCDDDPDPLPLVRGEILKRQFRTLRVAPFARASWESGSVSATVFATVVPFNNQGMALRLWTRAPDTSRQLLPETRAFVQEVLATNSLATLPATFLHHLHVPGAKSIVFFASNHNTANPAAVSVSLSACRPEVAPGDNLVTTHYLSTHNKTFGTLVIPAAAAEYTTTLTAVDPGFTEYYVWCGAATTPGVYTLHVGCLVTFYAT